jgi:hypothetical protein
MMSMLLSSSMNNGPVGGLCAAGPLTGTSGGAGAGRQARLQAAAAGATTAGSPSPGSGGSSSGGGGENPADLQGEITRAGRPACSSLWRPASPPPTLPLPSPPATTKSFTPVNPQGWGAAQCKPLGSFTQGVISTEDARDPAGLGDLRPKRHDACGIGRVGQRLAGWYIAKQAGAHGWGPVGSHASAYPSLLAHLQGVPGRRHPPQHQAGQKGRRAGRCVRARGERGGERVK